MISTSNLTPMLATRFARNTRVLRSDEPLDEDRMRAVAPSIFADGKHASRSARYTYIPTIDVLRGLRNEGFQPFMVAQGHSRIEGKTEYTKHMIRMRYSRPGSSGTPPRVEAEEVILINSHDGASSYQMLSGIFRFVCCNGLVVGDVADDVRIPHKGDIRDDVIEGAFRVLHDFEKVSEHTDAMKDTFLDPPEAMAFATAALSLRFGAGSVEAGGGHIPAPVTALQLIEARRAEDTGRSVWDAYQRVQENMMKGGLSGRSANGRRMHTLPVASIDRSVSLNRALWTLATEMHRLKGRG